MPDANTHPWVCINWDPAGNSVAQILKETGCSLYLIYLSDGTTTASKQVVTNANSTWTGIAAALNKFVVPLCSATYLVEKSGGCNWRTCDAQAFSDPGAGKQALPYALWFLSFDRDIAVPIVEPSDTGKLKGRLVLDNGKIVSGTEANDLNSSVKTILENSVLAQALALKWLCEHRLCATKPAIINSTLLDELCPKKTTASPATDDQSKKDMEPA